MILSAGPVFLNFTLSGLDGKLLQFHQNFFFSRQANFLNTEIIEIVKFLDPETADILPFLDPEILKLDQHISGSRNCRNGAISES